MSRHQWEVLRMSGIMHRIVMQNPATRFNKVCNLLRVRRSHKVHQDTYERADKGSTDSLEGYKGTNIRCFSNFTGLVTHRSSLVLGFYQIDILLWLLLLESSFDKFSDFGGSQSVIKRWGPFLGINAIDA